MKINGMEVIVLNEENIQDFAEARNRLLSKTDKEWVLFLDDDEEVTPSLAEELAQVVVNSEYDAYRLKRKDIFLGRELRYGETANLSFVRLAKKTAGRWERPVHEQWKVAGKVGTLENSLIHRPHPDLSVFIAKVDKYSSMDASFRFDSGARSSLVRIIMNPVAKFFRNYFFLQGFRDGVPGFIMAAMMSFHSFLTWSKLYLLGRKR